MRGFISESYNIIYYVHLGLYKEAVKKNYLLEHTQSDMGSVLSLPLTCCIIKLLNDLEPPFSHVELPTVHNSQECYKYEILMKYL